MEKAWIPPQSARRTAPATPPAASPPRSEGTGPSPERRRELVHLYQEEALGHDDPQVANLKLFNGDVMLLALGYKQLLEHSLQDGASAGRRFERYADGLLKCTRQMERTAQIVQRLSANPSPE